MRNAKGLLLSIFFLLAGETVSAQDWKLEQIITVKQVCVQASLMETLGAISDKNLAKQLEVIYAVIGGKENYGSYVDIYCSCKARSISSLYSYEAYMLDTHQTEKSFLKTAQNKKCATKAFSNAESLRDEVSR